MIYSAHDFIIYFSNLCPFYYTAVKWSGKVRPLIQTIFTDSVAV